jgi:hypothetical protein
MDERNDPSIPWLNKLEASLKWEVRSFYLVVVVLLASYVSQIAGLVIGSLFVLFTVALDTAFSVLATMIFVRPISAVLKIASVTHRSAGYKNMQKTKWMSLTGTMLTVSSSTLLYINLLLFFTVKGKYWSDPWLNVMVSGFNIAAMVSDVGMLLVCGIFKNISASVNAMWSKATSLPLHLEKCWCASARSEHAHPKLLATFLAFAVLGLVCLPLFVTGETSFQDAQDACSERYFVQLAKFYFEGEEWGVDDVQHLVDAYAQNRLFPFHLLNSLATVVSLAGICTWLFDRPQNSDAAAVKLDQTRELCFGFHNLTFCLSSDIFYFHALGIKLKLNKTVGSFYAVQFLGSVLITGSSMYICSSSATGGFIGNLINLLAQLSISCFGTNLMCHRFLYQKAAIMVQM